MRELHLEEHNVVCFPSSGGCESLILCVNYTRNQACIKTFQNHRGPSADPFPLQGKNGLDLSWGGG